MAPTDSKSSSGTTDANANAPAAAIKKAPATDQVLNVNIGILGHVDSGKTSLVKTLSTLLSTASLDKSKQSRQRGMTLDLGFSCFFLPLPPHLASQLQQRQKDATSAIAIATATATATATPTPIPSQLQMTLVDCPGHASLIRTIIGGAQIIDMVLLVVDAYKGWQAQTTECLVLAELTSPHLVVALNKVDMFPEAERAQRLEEAKDKVRQRLAHSKFPNAPMVGVSACVGGEKVAAAVATTTTTTTTTTSDSAGSTNAGQTTASTGITAYNQQNPTHNIDVLVKTLQDSLPIPNRIHQGSDASSSFYFAIDHCFPIKGMGTVLTGTCLSGSVQVNDTIEFPTLARMERKIKSMQMFKRKTMHIQQGDRAGICVSSLDSNLLERGICAYPKSVELLHAAVCLVRKIPQFPGTLKNGSKVHVSVGHTTVMATVTFWGARELLKHSQEQYQRQRRKKREKKSSTSVDDDNNSNNKNVLDKTVDGQQNLDGSALGGDADRAGLPYLKFDWKQDFLQQDSLLEEIPIDIKGDGTVDVNTSTTNIPLLHWAVLEFQSPVYCPLNSLIIGSRLDVVENKNHHHSHSNKAGTSSNEKGGKEVPTRDTNTILQDSASSCRLAFCGRLVTPLNSSSAGSHAKSSNNDNANTMSRIRWYNPKERRGVVSRLGDPFLRQDDSKTVRYEVFAGDLFKKETVLKPFLGMKVVTPQGDVGEIKSAFGTSGKCRLSFPAGTTVREGEPLVMPFKRFVHDPEKKMRQDDWILPKARSGSRIEIAAKPKKKKPEASGQVEKCKGDVLPLVETTDKTKQGTTTTKYSQAIIVGLFKPEDNIRDRIGQVVRIPSTNEEGTIAGSFGKAGKCKVNFPSGISESAVGMKADLIPR